MPPVAAAIAAIATAISAGTGVSVGIVTSVLVSGIITGAQMAVGAIVKLFVHPKSTNTTPASSLLAVRDPIAYRRVIYGTTRVGGIITDIFIDDLKLSVGGAAYSRNTQLHIVITVAGHKVDSISHSNIYLDGVAVPLALGGDGAYHPTAASKYKAHMYVEFSTGDPTFSGQPFPLLAADNPTHWTANHKQQGCAKVHVRLLWDATIFQNGMPSSIAFDVNGKQVFDPRTGTTVFSNNSALCVRDFLTDTEYGFGANPADIDDNAVIAAANICDELVTKKDSTTQKRYTCDGAFTSDRPRGDVLNGLLGSMSGFVVPPGDKWRIFAGAYTNPVLSLTDADLTGPIKYDTHVAQRDLCNSVKGTYISAAHKYQPADFTPLQNATYVAEDGDVIWQDVQFDFTNDDQRAQRLAKIIIEKSRRQNSLLLPCKLTAFQVQPGDTIEFSHARFGFVNKTFLVTNTSLEMSGTSGNPVLGVTLTCSPIDVSVYGWNASTDENTTTAPGTAVIPDVGTVATPTGLTLTNVEVARADGLKALQIRATWDPIKDVFVNKGGKVAVWVRDHAQPTTIPASTIPYLFTPSGLNSAYAWNWDNDGTPPISIPVNPGDSITVGYVSGSGLYSAAGVATDLNGDPGGLVGQPGPFPASFGSSGPSLGVLGLIGSFTDVDGAIITGEIHRMGNGPTTLTAPTGAAFLLLGLNDNFFGPGTGVPPDGPNTGNFIVHVTGGGLNWRLAGYADGSDSQFYIAGVTDGTAYDVMITAVNAYGVSSAGDEVDNFTATATTATFSGTVSGINSVSDVAVSSPVDGYVLTWNAATSKWIAAPVPAGGSGITVDWTRDGSSLTGWTLGAIAPTVKTHTDNPRINPPAILCLNDASSRGYAFIDPAIALAAKTIEFDILVTSNANIGYLIFGITSAGTGQGVFMDFRGGTFPGGILAHFTGFAADAYVDSDNNDPLMLDKLIGQWVNVKAVIDNTAANVVIYVNGQMWHKAALAAFAGTGIAIGGGSVGSGAYFRNIIIGH